MSYVLINDRVRSNALEAVRNAPPGYIVDIREPTRSSPQNRKFHAICNDLSKSGLKWAGKEHDATNWKALLVSAHSVATGAGGDVIPGLEGEFVAIRESTARMAKGRATSLIEYALAFCAMNNVEIKDTRDGGWME